jgi:D-arabinose 1-dehydrogenase-like Zn-dependent alcohol dehydrogenase
MRLTDRAGRRACGRWGRGRPGDSNDVGNFAVAVGCLTVIASGLVDHAEGRNDVRLETVPDPVIEQPRDAVAKVTSTAICGSDDLHLYDGYIPAIESGDTLRHEFMVDVVEVGSEDRKLRVGDRAVVPFNIAAEWKS